ncbi:MAG: hypothetical protein ACLFSQ_02835 [Candidatus Zixiibacteriota bacterium]
MAELVELLIPLTFITLLMAIPILSIIRKILADKALERERILAIEKGVGVPPMVDNRKSKKKLPSIDLRNGIIAVFVGLAFIALAVYGHGWNPFGVEEARGFSYILVGAGLIVGFVGIAKILWFFIAKNHFPELSDNDKDKLQFQYKPAPDYNSEIKESEENPYSE